jgi:hypothetical protein
LIFPALNQAIVYCLQNGAMLEEKFDLPGDFDSSVFHLLRVEADARFIKLSVDEANFRFEKILEKPATKIALGAEKIRAGFSAFALTEGFEDLFDWQSAEVERRGWSKLLETGECRVENGELFLANKSETDAVLTKGDAAENFEFALNIRLAESFGENAAFGFLLLNESNEKIERLTFEGEPENFYLSAGNASLKFSLPVGFMPENLHQFRLLKLNGKILLQLESIDLGEILLTDSPAKVALFCRNSAVAFEMARLTVL